MGLKEDKKNFRVSFIKEHLEKGFSIRQISEKMGVHYTTVMRIINKEKKGVLRDAVIDNMSIVDKTLNDFNVNNAITKGGWLKTKDVSLRFETNEQLDTLEQRVEKIIKKIKNKSPNYKPLKRKKLKNGHCLMVDFADHHFNKLSSEKEVGSPYNTQIAIKRWHTGLEETLAMAKGFPVDKIIFVIGNDILNTDGALPRTTKGTPQDTDTMWHEALDVAYNCLEHTLLKLLEIADVEVIHCPSNHDFVLGSCLAKMIEKRFLNHPNIKFDVSMKHRKYIRYGTSLIGFDHGDGAKEQECPLLMATEKPKEWAKTNFRYFFKHHLHHRIAKEYQGVEIRYLRSASGDDRWHYTNGYIAQPAIDSFIFGKEGGKIAELTYYFND